jgi:integrase
MAGAPLVKTTTSGIYRREGDRGTRYVVIYRDRDGKQRKETARTLDEARALKRRREGGETNAAGRLTFAAYAREWVERHPARDTTRSDYRRHLERWLVPFIGESTKLADVSPLLVNRLVGHLRAAEGRSGPLADSTVETILKPLRACMGQAVREGLIPTNPTRDMKLAKRETIDDEDMERVRALTADQLATFLAIAPERHRLMFRFMAATGLRISEVFALEWRHLELDGKAHVKVRRAIVRGKVEPPKTRHGRRDVPLPSSLVGGGGAGPPPRRSGRGKRTSCSRR